MIFGVNFLPTFVPTFGFLPTFAHFWNKKLRHLNRQIAKKSGFCPNIWAFCPLLKTYLGRGVYHTKPSIYAGFSDFVYHTCPLTHFFFYFISKKNFFIEVKMAKIFGQMGRNDIWPHFLATTL